MPRRTLIPTLAVLAVMVAVTGVVTLWPPLQVLAQPDRERDRDEGPGAQRPPFGRGGPGEFERGRDEFGGPGGMPLLGGGRGGAALAVSGEYVYVLHGNTLYQFAAEDLKLVKKVTLEEDRPMGPPMGPPGGERRDFGGRRPGGPRPPGGERPY